MSVRISYATVLEDIPKEVEVLINDIRGRLRNIEDAALLDVADSLERSGKISDCTKSIVALDSVRKNLVKIDGRLEDCVNILLQYTRLANPTPQPDASKDESQRATATNAAGGGTTVDAEG